MYAPSVLGPGTESWFGRPPTDPSPVPLRLVKAPERDTLSPGERAVYSLLTADVHRGMRDMLSPEGEGSISGLEFVITRRYPCHLPQWRMACWAVP